MSSIKKILMASVLAVVGLFGVIGSSTAEAREFRAPMVQRVGFYGRGYGVREGWRGRERFNHVRRFERFGRERGRYGRW